MNTGQDREGDPDGECIDPGRDGEHDQFAERHRLIDSRVLCGSILCSGALLRAVRFLIDIPQHFAADEQQ